MKKPSSNRKSSISSSLSFWFCGVSFALVIILSEGIYQLASRAMAEQSTRQLDDLAFQIATRLDEGIYERFREAKLLAARPEFTEKTTSLTEKERVLTEIKDTYSQYVWIGLTDNAGTVVASTNGMMRGHDLSKSQWFINANQGVNIGDVRSITMPNDIASSGKDESVRVIDIAFPYFDKSGAKVGILGVQMNWEWAKMIEKSVIKSGYNQGQLDGMIIDSTGKIILGAKKMLGMRLTLPTVDVKGGLKAHTEIAEWLDENDFLVGQSRTRGYASFPGLGWSVIVRQPTKDAFAPAWELRKTVLVMGIGIALLFSLFGRYSARRITRSIRYLSRSARDVAEGKATNLTVPADSYPEVDQLWSSLNTLLQNHIQHESELTTLNATLEARVIERTLNLQISKERLKTITNSIPALIAYVDKDRRYQFCNSTYEDWYGIDTSTAKGKTIGELLGQDRYTFAEKYVDQAISGATVKFEMELVVSGKKRYINISYIPDAQNSDVAGFYVLGQDVTDAKLLQIALEHEVIHDELTRLPNRRGCMDAIDAAIDRAKRSKNAMAVMFLDLNKFKAINDVYGHATGDAVLVEFARRLKSTVRETDCVARLSGDEFVIVAENLVQGRENAQQIAENILTAMHREFVIEGFNKPVFTSIGIALHTAGITTAEELLSAADEAMYKAKGEPRSGFEFHD